MGRKYRVFWAVTYPQCKLVLSSKPARVLSKLGEFEGVFFGGFFSLLRGITQWDNSHRPKMRRKFKIPFNLVFMESPNPTSAQPFGIGRQHKVLNSRGRVLNTIEIQLPLARLGKLNDATSGEFLTEIPPRSRIDNNLIGLQKGDAL